MRTKNSSFEMKWNLTGLFQNSEREFQAIRRTIMREVKAFESLQRLLISARPRSAFLEALQRAERIACLSHKLEAFSYLWFSENTGNQRALAFKTKIEQLGAEISNRVLFFDLWWQSVEDSRAQKLLKISGLHRYRLETIRFFRPHTLSEDEEKIVTIKNITGSSAIITVFDVLTSSLTFELRKSNGKKKILLTREELTGYMRHVDSELRVCAYKEFFRVFEGQSVVIGELYKARVMDWKNEQLSLRRHRSPIAARNMRNDLPGDVVNMLLKVCQKNAHIFQRYFSVKARLCGMRTMNRFHIYAPFRKTAKRYRYQDAVHMVLEAYRNFSPELANHAEQVFRENHIDAESRLGKMAGAYCYSVIPGLTPYVMMNFRGDPRDVATLAHEIGHAVHGMMAADQSVFSFHSTLPLAETASVFGERLLADFLLIRERNTAVRQQLLVSQLDDLYATILRQAFFTQFEMQAHRIIEKGATTVDLCGVYLDELRGQFGKQVVVPDEFQWEWLTIPHFYHTPFYCYAYSFGTLLALALHRRYLQEGKPFVSRYLALLAVGGSESPEIVLTAMGVNIRSMAFWQSGFDAIVDMVNTLERTIA